MKGKARSDWDAISWITRLRTLRPDNCGASPKLWIWIWFNQLTPEVTVGCVAVPPKRISPASMIITDGLLLVILCIKVNFKLVGWNFHIVVNNARRNIQAMWKGLRRARNVWCSSEAFCLSEPDARPSRDSGSVWACLPSMQPYSVCIVCIPSSGLCQLSKKQESMFRSLVNIVISGICARCQYL